MVAGRTSRVREGTVRAIRMDQLIALGDANVEHYRFTGLIEMTPVSAAGDSGAPVVTTEGKLVGFVFAGSEESTIVMPIGPVLRALNVELAVRRRP